VVTLRLEPVKARSRSAGTVGDADGLLYEAFLGGVSAGPGLVAFEASDSGWTVLDLVGGRDEPYRFEVDLAADPWVDPEEGE